MNKYKILLIFTIFLFSCEQEKRDDNLETKEIVLNDVARNNNVEIPVEAEPEIIIETFLDIEEEFPGLKVEKKLDLNLDGDTYTEQFIVLTDKDKRVTVVVADFYVATKDYIVAWQEKLPIIYNEEFTITEQDILGIQQDFQLVITGITSDKLNALFIFQKTAAPRGLHIYYKRIFSSVTEGVIEIVKKERSLDYVEKQKNQGKSYDISIELNKMINENTLAVTKENWVWDRRKRLFIKESSNVEEFKINVKEKLTAIYKGSKKDFLNFLGGEWYLVDDNDSIDTILVFDSINERVQFSYKNGIEIFNFRRFNSWYRTMDIYLRNKEVNTLPARITLTLDDTDEITIGGKHSSDAFRGTYKRLRNEQKKSLISNINTDIKQASPFTGVFKNVLYSINFSYPDYKKIDNDGIIEEGIYSILKLSNGITIMQMKSNDKIVHNYRLVYEEQKLESQIIRTIKIHEGILTTYGIEISPETDQMKFEQTEVISGE